MQITNAVCINCGHELKVTETGWKHTDEIGHSRKLKRNERCKCRKPYPAERSIVVNY